MKRYLEMAMSKVDQLRFLREANQPVRNQSPLRTPLRTVTHTDVPVVRASTIEDRLTGRAMTAAERQAKWREAHPEEAREATRKRMQRLRSKSH